MCIACSPGFQAAFRSLSWPSRRKLLKSAAALAVSGPFVAEAVGPSAARADGAVNESLATGLGADASAPAPSPVTIFTAQKIITMERGAASSRSARSTR
jgi:hypothetical protein